MSQTLGPETNGTSTRPYLVRALHDWCTDNGFTPYLAVYVDHSVQVPMEYVKNNEIVLNVGFEATSGLKLGNENIEFRARFGGVSRDIVVPVDHVVAIYARENGQGMAFPVPAAQVNATTTAVAPAPVKGLRLAASDPQGPAAVPEAPSPRAGWSDEKPEPPPPPPPPSPAPQRPALKRVK